MIFMNKKFYGRSINKHFFLLKKNMYKNFVLIRFDFENSREEKDFQSHNEKEISIRRKRE